MKVSKIEERFKKLWNTSVFEHLQELGGVLEDWEEESLRRELDLGEVEGNDKF